MRPVFSIHVATQLITLMFLYSGFVKVTTLGEAQSEVFQGKLNKWMKWMRQGDAFFGNGAKPTLQRLIFAAGMFELIAVALIEYGVFASKTPPVFYGSYMLVAFTVIVTPIFYAGPVFSVLPLLSNMTTLGALLGLYPYACGTLDKANCDMQPLLF